MPNFYGATSASGGSQGAMDDIDGAVLSDGDFCVVGPPESGGDYEMYTLDADSGAVEADGIVAPDVNAGNKRWIRKENKWQGSVKTVSTSAPSGGSDGDIHFQYIV